jgi:hypothetical protein
MAARAFLRLERKYSRASEKDFQKPVQHSESKAQACAPVKLSLTIGQPPVKLAAFVIKANKLRIETTSVSLVFRHNNPPAAITPSPRNLEYIISVTEQSLRRRETTDYPQPCGIRPFGCDAQGRRS